MAASVGIHSSMAAAVASEEEAPLHSPGKGAQESELARARRIAAATRRHGLLRFIRFIGDSKDGDIVPVARPLDHRDLNKYREEKERLVRSMMPGHLERLAMDRQFVEECLRHYNTRHPGDEYEPAPGELTRYGAMRKNKVGWTHGNFVARRKRNGCFSIFPAPRTIFFFELMSCDNFEGVITCTPLDEPVTEAYSILGFPLWWTTRRNGKMDCICKTCYRHYKVPHPFIIKKTYPCGHDKVERVCEMCYLSSGVLHPFPGEFTYGYREYSYLHC